MPYDVVPVFLSSPMHTAAAVEIRSRVRELFETENRLSLFQLYAMESVASAAEPPPETDRIYENAFFLLVLPSPDISEAVAGEVVTAIQKHNKMLCFFSRGPWDHDAVREKFLDRFPFPTVPTYCLYTSHEDLCNRVVRSLVGDAVRLMTSPAPPSWDILLFKAEQLVNRKQFGAAAEALSDMLRGRAASFEGHFRRGFLYDHYLKRHSDAVADFRTCVGLKVDSIESHFNLAVALSHLPDGAREAVEEYDETERLLFHGECEQAYRLLHGKLLLFRGEAKVSLGSLFADMQSIARDMASARKKLAAIAGEERATYWVRQVPQREAAVREYLRKAGFDYDRAVGEASLREASFPYAPVDQGRAKAEAEPSGVYPPPAGCSTSVEAFAPGRDSLSEEKGAPQDADDPYGGCQTDETGP